MDWPVVINAFPSLPTFFDLTVKNGKGQEVCCGWIPTNPHRKSLIPSGNQTWHLEIHYFHGGFNRKITELNSVSSLAMFDYRRVAIFLLNIQSVSHWISINFSPLHGSKTSVSQLPPRTDYPFRILPFDGILGLAPSASGGSVMHASGTLSGMVEVASLHGD